MRSERGYWICAALLVAAAFCASLWFYPSLPDRVPTHWNVRGQVNAYGPKATVFVIPCAMLAILGLFAALPWLSPIQFELDTFRSTYLFITVAFMGMMAYIHATILWAIARPPLRMDRAIMGGLFVFLALLGNVMGKVRRNFWIGIRTPWTLADERVWDATHRLGGHVMVVAGILGLIATLWGIPMNRLWIFFAAILIPVIYSLILYKRLNDGAGKS